MGSVDGLPPILSNLTIDYGNSSVDVDQVEATDRVYIYACSIHAPVGLQLVSVGVGPGTYNPPLNAFLYPFLGTPQRFQAPVALHAVWTVDDVNFSAPSNLVSTGIVLIAGYTFSGISIDVTGKLHVTIAGLSSANDLWYVCTHYPVGGGYISAPVAVFKGNGAKVSTPGGFFITLDPTKNYDFFVAYFFANGTYAEIAQPVFRYSAPPPPHTCRPRQAPGLEERYP